MINYGPGEESLAGEAVAASGGSAVALFSSLSELMALARRAELFIGGDTGPMHLAALLGVKTVALFGPTDPARNGPYWAGHPSPARSRKRHQLQPQTHDRRRACEDHRRPRHG